MAVPTEHSLPALAFGPTRLRKKRLKLVGLASGSAPPTDSPVKVWNGAEWVSTGVSVVAPT